MQLSFRLILETLPLELLQLLMFAMNRLVVMAVLETNRLPVTAAFETNRLLVTSDVEPAHTT
jgi:hypothetical protein